ncbi:RDD family protein [Flammeovirgaceae bacterium SG7u.111]|nr:RDD family protein [Flammeovirgaceae bacterium SG7u.132]WPO37469.1 RDD family protein [Flammeovirgaceae bacterium SG7u.111]
MKTIDITTPQNVTIRYELADLKDRIIAFVIDFLILVTGISIMSAILTFAFIDTWGMEFVMVINVLVFVFYTPVSEILTNGQTLGKKSLKIRVIHLTGRPPNISDYLIRWSFRMVDIWFSSGTIAAVLCNTTSTGQRLGGMLSNTTVIKERPSNMYSLHDLEKIQTADHYEPTYPAVASFKNEDMLLIKRVIDRALKYKNGAHSEALVLMTEKVAENLGIPTPKSDKMGFLKTVIKDYIVLTR